MSDRPPYPPPPPPPPPGDYGGGYYGQPAPGQKPDNYLVWAILSTLFCCLPLGVVSIVYAAQVDGKWSSGDYAGAVEASNRARTFAMVSAGAAVLAVLGFFLLVAAGSGSSEF